MQRNFMLRSSFKPICMMHDIKCCTKSGTLTYPDSLVESLCVFSYSRIVFTTGDNQKTIRYHCTNTQY